MLDRVVDNLILPLIAGILIWMIDKFLPRLRVNLQFGRRNASENLNIRERENIPARNRNPKPNPIADFFSEPITRITLIITIAISAFIVLEAIYPELLRYTSQAGFTWLKDNFPVFTTSDDIIFVEGFIQSFGVVFGVTLITVLILVLVQHNRIEQTFDREANTIKILHDNVIVIDNQYFLYYKAVIIYRLLLYTQHIRKNYWKEHLEESVELMAKGSCILQEVRGDCMKLLNEGQRPTHQIVEVVASELLRRIDSAIEVREKRISFTNYWEFQSLQLVLMSISILWLVPFYLLNFETGLFGSFLKLGVTFLVIYTLSLVNDLGYPFSGSGIWSVRISSWVRVQEELKVSFYNLQKGKRAAIKTNKRKPRKQTK